VCESVECGVQFTDMSIEVTDAQIAIYVNADTFKSLAGSIAFRGKRSVTNLDDGQKAVICTGLLKFVDAVNAASA
jgi:hypothetical protein